MSVWERNHIWYYQFRHKGIQYSGRANGATSAAEARVIEEARKAAVIGGLEVENGMLEEQPPTEGRGGKNLTITLILEAQAIKEILAAGVSEVTLRLRSPSGWAKALAFTGMYGLGMGVIAWLYI